MTGVHQPPGPMQAARPGSINPNNSSSLRVWLLVSTALTLGLYVAPMGRWLSWPLVLISTLAHEMGHGIAALLVGGKFQQFVLFADASGMATTQFSGRLSSAFVSAGGLVGPALTAALCFVLARKAAWCRAIHGIVALLLSLALLLVVRNVFGFAFIALLAVIHGAVALKASPRVAQVLLLFLGTQLALSVFSRGDYLFTAVAVTGAGTLPSDVAQMAQALWLPYWFWGGVCGVLSLAVLALGLRVAWKS